VVDLPTSGLWVGVRSPRATYVGVDDARAAPWWWWASSSR